MKLSCRRYLSCVWNLRQEARSGTGAQLIRLTATNASAVAAIHGTGSINDATHAKLSSNTSLGSAQYLLARAQKINRGVKGRLQSWSIGLGRSRPSAAVDRCHPLRVTIRCSSTWQSLLRKVPQLKGRMRG
jgi:hypothetical protein